MAKLPSVSTITTGYASVQALNDNFEALKTAFTNTVSRDGSTPNSMSADLDMNSNDVKNVKTIDADSFILNGTLMTPSGVDPVYSGTISTFGASLIDDADAATARTTLGLGALATQDISYVNTNANVSIDNSNWTGADLEIVNGGTGASSASTARNNLGLGTAAVVDVLDEDDMVSDSATDVPSQQSVKAYVDASSPITTTSGSAPYYGVRAWGKVASNVLVDGGNFASWNASVNVVLFTTAMPHDDYAVVINGPSAGNTWASGMGTTGFVVNQRSSGGNSIDPSNFEFIVIC